MQTLHGLLTTNARVLNRHVNKVYGFVPGIVVELHDDDNNRHMYGYVRVYFPTLQYETSQVEMASGGNLKNIQDIIAPWARVATPATGQGAGTYCMPQLGDEVLCAFEHGDPHHPYMVGALWNGVDKLPKCQPTADNGLASGSGTNKVAFWRSRTGNIIAFDDQDGLIYIADRTSQSSFQLKEDEIAIAQTSKDIRISVCDTLSFECEDFVVNASKSISNTCGYYGASAGSSYNVSADKEYTQWSKTTFKTKAGKDYVVGAQESLEILAKTGSIEFTGGGDVLISAPAGKMAIEASVNVSAQTACNVAADGPNELLIKAGAAMSIMAAKTITFKGSSAQLNCGGGGGFSLFKAIANAIVDFATDVVQGAVAAAKAVAGAVVAGAQALGAAAMAAANAILGIAGDAGDIVSEKASNTLETIDGATQAAHQAIEDQGMAALDAGADPAEVAEKMAAAHKAVEDSQNATVQQLNDASNDFATGTQEAGMCMLNGDEVGGDMGIDGTVASYNAAVEGAALNHLDTTGNAIESMEGLVSQDQPVAAAAPEVTAQQAFQQLNAKRNAADKIAKSAQDSEAYYIQAKNNTDTTYAQEAHYQEQIDHYNKVKTDAAAESVRIQGELYHMQGDGGELTLSASEIQAKSTQAHVNLSSIKTDYDSNAIHDKGQILVGQAQDAEEIARAVQKTAHSGAVMGTEAAVFVYTGGNVPVAKAAGAAADAVLGTAEDMMEQGYVNGNEISAGDVATSATVNVANAGVGVVTGAAGPAAPVIDEVLGFKDEAKKDFEEL